MRRIAIIVAIVTGIVAAPAVVAATDSRSKSADTPSKTDPYAQAHNVSSPLGPLYGPVRAGSESSSSYGYLAK